MAHEAGDDRRRFLGQLGGVAALGLLAGCGKKETAETADMAPPMPDAGGEPPAAPAPPGPVDTGAAAPAAGPVEAGTLDKLADGQGTALEVAGKPVVVIREGEQVKAFQAVCTHKGCTLTWSNDTKEFLCPCHKSTFDATGKVTKGPATEPLPEVPAKVEDGKVMVG